MLHWAATFLVVAVVAAVLGFGGLARESAWIAQVIFLIFVVMFVASTFGHFGRGPRVGSGPNA